MRTAFGSMIHSQCHVTKTHGVASRTQSTSLEPRLQQNRHLTALARRTTLTTTKAQPEEDLIASNPLFSEQFASVLKDSLARQGPEKLYEQAQAEGPRTSALEDVLGAALQTSKQQYRMMVQWRDQLDKTIVAQEKQINRMEFAYNKSIQDAAYNRALKDMLYNEQSDA